MTNHKAVSTDGIFKNWRALAQSSNADLLHELESMRARSRDLQRNNGIATSILETIVDKAIGQGLKLTPQIDYKAFKLDKSGKRWTEKQAKEWNETVEVLWNMFANSKNFDVAGKNNFAECSRLALKTALLNGEVLALPHWKDDNHSMFSTQMQLIECDRLVTPENKQNDKNFRAGIQFDKNNRPIAYYISKEYPGDSLGFYDSKIQRINATTNFGRKRVIHIFKQDRVDQSRGKPIFSPVLSMFKKLDMYEEAELTAAVVSAVVAMIVTTEGGSAEDIAKGLGLESPELVLPTKKDWPRNFANGKVFNLFPGEKLETFSPNRPNSAFSAFVENITKNICVATGLPYEMIMKDFSKCNYSSARAALQEGWERILTVRNWFIDEWVKEIYALFIEEIANKGLIEAPDFYKYKEAYLKFAVHGPVRGILDPVKEANAASIRMEQGISTLQEECAATGSNWEDTLLQKKKEQEFAKKLGLNITNLTVSEETTTKEQAESA